MHKRQRKRIEAQQTRTLDLLKGLCKKNQKMMLEVFWINEIGEPTILRPLSADEAYADVFKSLCSRSHDNSLLFFHKNGCVSTDLCPQVDELLEQMESTIKTFPSLHVAPMTDEATHRLNFPQLCQCDWFWWRTSECIQKRYIVCLKSKTSFCKINSK